jgi:hypothetical protein
MKMFLAAALIAVTAPACATPFTITDVQPDRAQVITIGTPLPAPLTAYVGRLDLTTSTGKTFFAWCIDLFHDVNVGAGQSLPYTTGPIVTDHHGNLLTIRQKDEIAGLIAHGNALLSAGGTSDDSAATQLAIWKVEYPTLTYSGASASTIAEESALLALAPHLGGGANSLVALGGTQSFAGTVDAPASAMLLLGGLPLLWAARRRRG